MFENRKVRRIFGSKRQEVAGGWRRLHNEELHNLYATPNFITVMKSQRRLVGHMACMGDMTNAYSILGGKPEGKRLLIICISRWEDNMRMDLKRSGV
jgi:hypothetical protein